MSAYLARIACSFVSALAVAAPLFAQHNRPIYPAYQGFITNPDGSYTLAFGYFSHNADVVKIPAGPANGWSPTPTDRQAPQTFLPGHHEFQCVMVVGADYDGKLNWTLAYAGTTTGTSQHQLQSSWNLIENIEALKHVDFAHVNRGVCLNQPPRVRVLGIVRNSTEPLKASVGRPMSLFGSVLDEGLPRARPLIVGWRQLTGPAPAVFADQRSARTRVSFATPGDYELQLTASDSEYSRSIQIRVAVR